MNPTPSDWSRMAEIMDAQFIGGILGKLYYKIGKQTTNFAVQYSKREGEDVTWSKRQLFLDLDPNRDQWFIAQLSHRQILKNEIIFDFDRLITKEEALEDKDVKKLVARLERDKLKFCMYHTGSRGVHLHVYVDKIATMEKHEREEFRKEFLRTYDEFAGVDFQKTSDSCMIAMEFVPHWKTYVEKTMLFKNGDDLW